MKKLIIAILLFSLAGCTTNTQLGAEKKIEELSREITSINIDGVMTSIEFTDDNTNEDIIIKSDQKEYFNLGGTFTSYFSVENKTGVAQDIDTVFALNTGDVLEVFEYNGYIEEDIIVEKEVSATSTKELGANETKTKTTSKWKSKSLKKADKYKKDKVKITNNKGLLGATEYTRKDIKETDATKIFTDTFTVGEKKFYKASIKITSGDREEFFIEAFGEDGSYGILDPWSYDQDFDDLDDGTLVGQDSWSKTGGTDSTDIDSTYALLSSTKGVIFPVTVSLNSSYQRTVAGGTDGTFYFATKCTTVAPAGHQHVVSLDSGSTYGVFISWVRVDADTYKIQAYADGGYVDLFTGLSQDTTYVIAIEYETDTADQYRGKIKSAGGTFGSFSTWRTFIKGQSSMTRLKIIKDWGWGVIMDEFSATDPNPVTPPTSRRIISIE